MIHKRKAAVVVEVWQPLKDFEVTLVFDELNSCFAGWDEYQTYCVEYFA